MSIFGPAIKSTIVHAHLKNVSSWQPHLFAMSQHQCTVWAGVQPKEGELDQLLFGSLHVCITQYDAISLQKGGVNQKDTCPASMEMTFIDWSFPVYDFFAKHLELLRGNQITWVLWPFWCGIESFFFDLFFLFLLVDWQLEHSRMVWQQRKSEMEAFCHEANKLTKAKDPLLCQLSTIYVIWNNIYWA